MEKKKLTNHNDVLESIIEQIDISDAVHEKASNRYKSIGEWLDRRDSRISDYRPNIYSQGSFRLGTAIKPLLDSDDYDVDFVCELKNPPDDISQRNLKDLVGDEIKKYAKEYTLKLKEGKRCWTLNYAEEQQFHVDILPAKPDKKSTKENAILITDASESEWQHSNPIGYADWFRERQQNQIEMIRKSMIGNAPEGHLSLVQDIPDYKVKTPLQKAIQLLKQHRDLYFKDKSNKIKPISIIITTLAARAYNNESTVIEALRRILSDMEKFIENKNGTHRVVNPVNDAENFADKWEDEPEKSKAFLEWLTAAQRDFETYFTSRFNEIPPKFEQALGPNIFKIVLALIVSGEALAAPSIRSNNDPSSALENDVSSHNTPTKPFQNRG